MAVEIWANHFGSGLGRAQYVYLPAAVLDRAMIVFVLVWLVGALRRIQAARLVLAEEALESERRRADDELSATVGVQLESVVRWAQRALETTRLGGRGAEGELESLVAGSRRALSAARRQIRRYRLLATRVELENAASLLRAAGIEVRVEVPDEQLPPALDESLRTALRAAVARLLAEGTTGLMLLKLARENGTYTLEVLPTASMEAAP